MTSRLVVGISGASGAIYGIRLLQVLKEAGTWETHLVMSRAARSTIAQETTFTPRDVEALATFVHSPMDIGAPIASGSFETSGMIVAPCSVKTLSAIACCATGDLLSRAADVQLKEGRRVLLLVRETPIHLGHIRLMAAAAEIGAIIMPPVPSFYGRPATVDDIVDQTVGRALSRLGVPNDLYTRWAGLKKERGAADD